MEWISSLAQAIAFVESLNLTYGDLRPDHILLDGDTLKVSDVDYAANFGPPFHTCLEPWGRVLSQNDPKYDMARPEPGLLGPRTEQFALGSI
ncbi:kinase-like protein [Penicillium odoratum]|uniref:kinase-like protein n=1 Tax=Penicillium odoratum TaxID=1167516 RepID=UPI002548AF33|nr:kinase-like protein [Penicillium odoratum]KAJ5772488.1 kinase-like protein [Penicillium odoratum]